MRTFTLIWCGQIVSSIGSTMTFFALTLWVWEQTGSATALALIGLCLKLTLIPTSLFAGIIVDRFNRKRLILMGDAMTVCLAGAIGLLHLTQKLQIWHLYCLAAAAGSFMGIQALAYQSSISLIVPKEHYTRAGGMGAAVGYGSNIIGPALAGTLYPAIGLSGIIGIDVVTFFIASVTLIIAPIPQPKPKSPTQTETSEPLFQRLTFGLRHLWSQPHLKTLMLLIVMFTLAHDLASTLQQPMILARTGGNSQVLGNVSAAAGIGGVMGALLTTVWGGPKKRMRGVLGGMIGAGLSKMMFGFGRSLAVWAPAQGASSLNFPLMGSCRNALWMEAITPEIQGRIFATTSLVVQVTSAIAIACAGPLADRLFEPAMQPEGFAPPWLTNLFGNGAGAGTAVLYTTCALSLFIIGLWGFSQPKLRTFEQWANTQKDNAT